MAELTEQKINRIITAIGIAKAGFLVLADELEERPDKQRELLGAIKILDNWLMEISEF